MCSSDLAAPNVVDNTVPFIFSRGIYKWIFQHAPSEEADPEERLSSFSLVGN